MLWKVPVIAVFTKYDQFKRDIRMKLGARSPRPAKKDVTDEAEKIFQEQYWNVIKGESPRHVRLECRFCNIYVYLSLIVVWHTSGMHKPGESCDALITETAHALSIEVVSLMLLAVQQGNLEMSVKLAVQR